MAGLRVSQSSGHSHWKQWWRRSPNTCCSKKILLLLVWHVLFTLSYGIIVFASNGSIVTYISIFLSYAFAPLIGWLADVKFIKFCSIASFLSSILYYFSIFTGGGVSTSSNVLLLIAIVIVGFGFTCYSAAILPFITDQIIGSTSDELSAVVHWYFWAQYVGMALSNIFLYASTMIDIENLFDGDFFYDSSLFFCRSSGCDHHQ